MLPAPPAFTVSVSGPPEAPCTELANLMTPPALATEMLPVSTVALPKVMLALFTLTSPPV